MPASAASTDAGAATSIASTCAGAPPRAASSSRTASSVARVRPASTSRMPWAPSASATAPADAAAAAGHERHAPRERAHGAIVREARDQRRRHARLYSTGSMAPSPLALPHPPR